MTTGVVKYGSDLERRKWMREGLIQSASTSFWSPMTGSTKDAIVYQSTNANAGDGHTVVFDYSGNISGKAIKGKETAYGKGEEKRKFSDKLTVERYRLVVDNGDEFDGVNIGDINLTTHADSRSKLGDLFTRFKDQSLFDAAQGSLGQAPSHVIDLGASFGYNDLFEIEKTLKTSTGFTTGGIRRPLDAYRTADGKPLWIFLVDSAMATLLKQDDKFQSIVSNADVRGNGNRLINGVIGKLGNLIIVEVSQFFGETNGTTNNWGLDASNIEISGMRQYDGAVPGSALWTGQEGFDYASSELHSRGLILGAGALQLGFGKMPDYKFQKSVDFGITSESAVEFWMDAKKAVMTAENTDYTQAKVANLDYGVVAVDVKIGA